MSSWRIYRQGALAILASDGDERAASARQLLLDDIADGWANPRTKVARQEIGSRTGSAKMKRFALAEFEQVRAYLKHFSQARSAAVLRDWLLAGVTTGLRPTEWRMSMLITDHTTSGQQRVVLRVRTAKATNGRGNSGWRHLDLSNFSPETLAAVRCMSEEGAAWELAGIYGAKQAELAGLLYNTCDQLFRAKPRNYCLYSLRHQFAANMKSLKDLATVAALMGHCSTATAVSAYGKRRHAWAAEKITDIPEAMPEEVGTVRENAKLFNAATFDRAA
nr:F43 [uncultured bacterium]